MLRFSYPQPKQTDQDLDETSNHDLSQFLGPKKEQSGAQTADQTSFQTANASGPSADIGSLEGNDQAFQGAKYFKSPVFSYSLIAGLAFALACFAKQTSVVCLLTAVLFLIWCKSYRIAGVVTAASTALILILFGLGQVITVD